mgnify:CR=1 FL=1
MEKGGYILSFVLLTFLFSSCSTMQQVEKNNTNEVTGYNLKSKKEQMHNKILHCKNKTVLATP